jgi:hypothetical protein
MPSRPTTLPTDATDALDGPIRAFAAGALARAEQELAEEDQRPRIVRVQLRMPIRLVEP